MVITLESMVMVNMEENMIEMRYGQLTKEQVADYIGEIRKMIFWCIIYTDPKTNEEYRSVDIVAYHNNIMKKINGFNSLLLYPNAIVKILTILESALLLLQSDDYTFAEYRSLILDAGATAIRYQASINDSLEAGDK